MKKLESYPYNQLNDCTVSFIVQESFHHTGILNESFTLAGEIVGLKSIAAYRSGLDINTHVTEKEAEEGLTEVLRGKCQLACVCIFILYWQKIVLIYLCLQVEGPCACQIKA